MSGIYIRVSEERVLYGIEGSTPEIERQASVMRREEGRDLLCRTYRRISEASVFRLVRIQDKLAGEGK